MVGPRGGRADTSAVDSLLLAGPRDLDRGVDAPSDPPWVRPWSEEELAEYERLVDREIVLIRARHRTYTLRVLAAQR